MPSRITHRRARVTFGETPAPEATGTSRKLRKSTAPAPARPLGTRDGLNTPQPLYAHSVKQQGRQMVDAMGKTKGALMNHANPAAVVFNNGTWDQVVGRICEDTAREQGRRVVTDATYSELGLMSALEWERKHRDGPPPIPMEDRLLRQTGAKPPTDAEYREAEVLAFLRAVGEPDPQAVLNSFKMQGMGRLHVQQVTGLNVANTALLAAMLLAPDPTYVTQTALASTREALALVSAERNNNAAFRRAGMAGTEERMVLGKADATPGAKVGRTPGREAFSVIRGFNFVERNLRKREALLVELLAAQTAIAAEDADTHEGVRAANRQALAEADKKLNFAYAKFCPKVEVREAAKVASDAQKIEFFGNARAFAAAQVGNVSVITAAMSALWLPLFVEPTTAAIIAGSAVAGAGGVMLASHGIYQIGKNPFNADAVGWAAQDGDAKARRSVLAWVKSTDVFTGARAHGQKDRAASHRQYVMDKRAARSEKGSAADWGVRQADAQRLRSLSDLSKAALEQHRDRELAHAGCKRLIDDAREQPLVHRQALRRQVEAHLSQRLQSVADRGSPRVVASMEEYDRAYAAYDHDMAAAEALKGEARTQAEHGATQTFAQALAAWAAAAPPSLKEFADLRAAAYRAHQLGLQRVMVSSGPARRTAQIRAENRLLDDLEALLAPDTAQPGPEGPTAAERTAQREKAAYLGDPRAGPAHAVHFLALQQAEKAKAGAPRRDAIGAANTELLRALNRSDAITASGVEVFTPQEAAARDDAALPIPDRLLALAPRHPAAAHALAHAMYGNALRQAERQTPANRAEAIGRVEEDFALALRDLADHTHPSAQAAARAIADAQDAHVQAVRRAVVQTGTAREAALAAADQKHLDRLHVINSGNLEAAAGPVDCMPPGERNWRNVRQLQEEKDAARPRDVSPAAVAASRRATDIINARFAQRNRSKFDAETVMSGWKGNLRMGMENAVRIANGSVAKTQRDLRAAIKNVDSRIKLHRTATLEAQRDKLAEQLGQELVDMFNLDLARRQLVPQAGQAQAGAGAIAAAAEALAGVGSETVHDLFMDEGPKQAAATLKAKELTHGEIERYTYTNAGNTAIATTASIGLIGTTLGFNAQRLVDADIKLNHDPTHVGMYDGLRLNDQNVAQVLANGGTSLTSYASAQARAHEQQRRLKDKRDIVARPEGEPPAIPSITVSGHQRCLSATDPQVKTQIANLIRQLGEMDEVPEFIELVVQPTATRLAPGRYKIDLRPTTAYQQSRHEQAPLGKRAWSAVKTGALIQGHVALSLFGPPMQGIAHRWMSHSKWLGGSRRGFQLAEQRAPVMGKALFDAAHTLGVPEAVDARTRARAAPPVDVLDDVSTEETGDDDDDSRLGVGLDDDASSTGSGDMGARRRRAGVEGRRAAVSPRREDAGATTGSTSPLGDPLTGSVSASGVEAESDAESQASRKKTSAPKPRRSLFGRSSSPIDSDAGSVDRGKTSSSWLPWKRNKPTPVESSPTLPKPLEARGPWLTDGEDHFFSGKMTPADAAEIRRRIQAGQESQAHALREGTLRAMAAVRERNVEEVRAALDGGISPEQALEQVLGWEAADVPQPIENESAAQRETRILQERAAFSRAAELVMDALAAPLDSGTRQALKDRRERPLRQSKAVRESIQAVRARLANSTLSETFAEILELETRSSDGGASAAGPSSAPARQAVEAFSLATQLMLAATAIPETQDPRPDATSVAALMPLPIDTAAIRQEELERAPLAAEHETPRQRRERVKAEKAAFLRAAERVAETLEVRHADRLRLVNEIRRDTPPQSGERAAAHAHDITLMLMQRGAANTANPVTDPADPVTDPADPQEARVTKRLMPHLRNELFQHGVTTGRNDGGILYDDLGEPVSEKKTLNSFVVALIMLATGQSVQTPEISRHADEICSNADLSLPTDPDGRQLGVNALTVRLVNVINVQYRHGLPPMQLTFVSPRMDDDLQVYPLMQSLKNVPNGEPALQVAMLRDEGLYEGLFVADPSVMNLNFKGVQPVETGAAAAA